MLSLETQRLLLIANDSELSNLQAYDHDGFFTALSVEAPSFWPPEPFGGEGLVWAAQQLARDPDGAGWYGWAILKEEGETRALVGAAALVGRPDLDGEVEIGFGILPEHAGRGYASEAVRALVDWALSEGARRVIAHLDAEDERAAEMLARHGFANTSEQPYPGVALWALSAAL